jgi:hypothetical protein
MTLEGSEGRSLLVVSEIAEALPGAPLAPFAKRAVTRATEMLAPVALVIASPSH